MCRGMPRSRAMPAGHVDCAPIYALLGIHRAERGLAATCANCGRVRLCQVFCERDCRAAVQPQSTTAAARAAASTPTPQGIDHIP